jgi:hypothetical protein
LQRSSKITALRLFHNYLVDDGFSNRIGLDDSAKTREARLPLSAVFLA